MRHLACNPNGLALPNMKTNNISLLARVLALSVASAVQFGARCNATSNALIYAVFSHFGFLGQLSWRFLAFTVEISRLTLNYAGMAWIRIRLFMVMKQWDTRRTWFIRHRTTRKRLAKCQEINKKRNCSFELRERDCRRNDVYESPSEWGNVNIIQCNLLSSMNALKSQPSSLPTGRLLYLW